MRGRRETAASGPLATLGCPLSAPPSGSGGGGRAEGPAPGETLVLGPPSPHPPDTEAPSAGRLLACLQPVQDGCWPGTEDKEASSEQSISVGVSQIRTIKADSSPQKAQAFEMCGPLLRDILHLPELGIRISLPSFSSTRDSTLERYPSEVLCTEPCW
ncbi:uncharacterized protein LOC125133837 isoform X2 [Phacochoerus africanus]|uniref:uncharacterized protein LOC125133837 isoform X2 n=1 Tax=Phacochoerus africanus TaxID=41426 RepID=UPI001FD9D9E6|nr:uncharacterized protein LOC125133837 isoform X2 [Phacochoerus africanus]